MNLKTRNDLIKEIEYLLNLELTIDFKKKNNIKLTKNEQFFDSYILKPSTIIKLLYKGGKL